MMTCNEALQILLEPNHAEPNPAKRSAAMAYLLSDQACLARVDQLAQAVLSKVDNEMPCVEARLRLAAYYERETAPNDDAQTMPELHAHLQRCAYCQADYRLLQETMRAVENNALPTVTDTYRFDLAFIDKPLSKLVPTREIWGIQPQLRRLFQQLEITITQSAAAIATLTPQLAPATFATALRGGDDDAEFAVVILPDEEAHIYFRVDTKPSQDGTALITLQILATEGDQPIPDARVMLRHVNGELVTSSLTGPKGEVEFPRIPADQYTIQTQYDGKTWELPMVITRR